MSCPCIELFSEALSRICLHLILNWFRGFAETALKKVFFGSVSVIVSENAHVGFILIFLSLLFPTTTGLLRALLSQLN